MVNVMEAKETKLVILVDCDNNGYKMLQFAIDEAKQITNNIELVSDWGTRIVSRKWKKVFGTWPVVEIKKKEAERHALDLALAEYATLCCDQGIRQFMILTTDNGFAKLARYLRSQGCKVYGIGDMCASDKLKSSYDTFKYYYPDGLAEKINHDYDIPPGEFNETVLEYLLHAYNRVGENGRWISSAKLGSSFRTVFPSFVFPADHPKKFAEIIKIYHAYFECKRRDRQIWMRPKEKV